LVAICWRNGHADRGHDAVRLTLRYESPYAPRSHNWASDRRCCGCPAMRPDLPRCCGVKRTAFSLYAGQQAWRVRRPGP
jgi:hypothetical protein